MGMGVDNSWGNKITKYVLYFLSFFFAFGPINPFAIGEEELDESLSPFLTIFTGLFVLSFFLFQSNLLKHDNKIRNIITPLIILFFAISLGDITYDINTAHYYFLLKFSVNIVAFLCLYVYFIHNPEQIEKSLRIFAFSCVLIILMLNIHMLDNFSHVHNGRLWLFGENPNNTSSRMSMALLILFYNATENNKIMIKSLYYIICVFIFYYIIQSGSRGSFIASLLGIGIIMLYRQGDRNTKIMQIIGIVIGALMLFPIIVENEDIGMFDRMEELSEGNSREQLIMDAIEIADDYPIVGCGHHGYIQEKMLRGMDLHDSHNMLASVFVMGGIVGLISLITFLLKLCRISYKSIKETPLSITLLLSMIFIAMKTGGVLTYMLMWYIYAVTLAMVQLKK